MFLIDNTSAAASLPTPAAAGTPGYFTDGVPGVTAATVVPADWLNAVQGELAAPVTAAGLTLSKTNRAQLLQAIRTLAVAHSGQAGYGYNTSTGTFSASLSFTPTFNGTLLINGNAGAVGGAISGSTLTVSGATQIGVYVSSASQGGTNNMTVFNAAYTIVSGTPVTITYTLTSTGGAGSAIGFIYSINPTS